MKSVRPTSRIALMLIMVLFFQMTYCTIINEGNNSKLGTLQTQLKKIMAQ